MAVAYMTDMRHYLDVLDPFEAENIPAPTRRITAFFGAVIKGAPEENTVRDSRDKAPPHDTFVTRTDPVPERLVDRKPSQEWCGNAPVLYGGRVVTAVPVCRHTTRR